MDDDVRAVRTLILLLLVSGGIRLGWQARSGGAQGIGTPVVLAELVDSASRVEADEARRSAPLASGEQLDLNTAPASELDRLPGVGPATADRIVAARAERPFGSVDDLARVSGIGPATLDRVRPHLMVTRSAASRAASSRAGAGGATVSRAGTANSGASRASPTRSSESLRRGATPSALRISPSPGSTSQAGGAPTATVAPIDPNLASAEVLQTLPGIGPSLAERWVQHRRSAGPFRTPDDLLAISGIGPATLERLRPMLAPVPWAARVAGG